MDDPYKPKGFISNGVHLKKSISLILIKLTPKKNWAKTFAVEISQIMTYNNAQV